ncbi:four-carbon acid sugar kinase family protein [Acidaminococcus timonensis]|uniref:four-carbon acid sugar kinase family protein n=1 Tax=Acidaminococcus timonensis TaxID=1871002 RepID=UPI0030792188
MKLLVLADDLTGALDTGIQFVAAGADTRVILNPQYPLKELDPTIDVVVIDTETRHIPGQKAYDLVHTIAEQAKELQIPCLYKKTDSGLRGNVGAELSAVLETEGGQLHFIPAFPKTHRYTKNGIHFIDGTPVAESVFGKDPFNPVKFSSVKEIIHEQTELPVFVVPEGKEPSEESGIFVYDAETDADIEKIAQMLQARGKLNLLAGCAGFASHLSPLLRFEQKKKHPIPSKKAFLLVCGSVNPITRKQVKEAVDSGKFTYLRVKPEQSLTPHWFESEQGKESIRQWSNALQQGKNCIIDTNDIPGEVSVAEYAKTQGMDFDDIQQQIPKAMGELLQGLFENGLDATVMVTGGDILMGMIRALDIGGITPIQELFTGTVLSTVTIDGKEQPLISKSGGFGDPDLLVQLLEKLGRKG